MLESTENLLPITPDVPAIMKGICNLPIVVRKNT